MSYNETLNNVQNSFINYMKYYENPKIGLKNTNYL